MQTYNATSMSQNIERSEFKFNNIDNLNLQEEIGKYYLRLPIGLQKVIKYIWGNYDKPIYAKTLTQLSGIKNESYFGKVFKNKMGCSYAFFTNGIRIKIAKEKLANTNYSISDISKQVGFNDLPSFNRIFKTFEKISPSIYRKNLASQLIIQRMPVHTKIELLSSVVLS